MATEFATRGAIVDALSEAQFADDTPARLLLLKLIGQNLRQPLTVANHPIGRDHLIEIVTACADVEGGMLALASAVSLLRPKSHVSNRIQQLVHQPQVRDLVPARAQDRLREWLADAHISQLPTLVRRAAEHAVIHTSECDTPWKAFRSLADLNAGPDGIPPALRFVELVATQIGGEIGDELRKWNDEQARGLDLQPELQAYRSNVEPVPVDSKLHLLIVIRHDGIDPDRWLLSHWRQDDPDVWPPANGGCIPVRSNELERVTDSLVVSAERAWSGHGGTVGLEFVLPRALLDLPVHLWHKEHDSGQPKPLCLDYPIVLRSLERMQSPHWHRVWRQRWRILIDSPGSARIHVGRLLDDSRRHLVEALLLDDQAVVMMVLASPPGKALSQSDEYLSAIRSGVPALIWHPSASPDDVHKIISSLTSNNIGFANLPRQVQALRNRAFIERTDTAIISDLVLLWDDPCRLVVDLAPGQPL